MLILLGDGQHVQLSRREIGHEDVPAGAARPAETLTSLPQNVCRSCVCRLCIRVASHPKLEFRALVARTCRRARSHRPAGSSNWRIANGSRLKVGTLAVDMSSAICGRRAAPRAAPQPPARSNMHGGGGDLAKFVVSPAFTGLPAYPGTISLSL
eukprot:1577476-Prymnesium_polylepis.1